MALKKSSEHLQTLINAGSDLMSNLYYVTISPPAEMADALDVNKVGLTIRNSDFKAPAATHSDHTVDYMTTSVTLPSAGFTIDKTFTLNFRLDANYAVYKFLKIWQSLTSNATMEYASTVVPGEDSSVIGNQGFIVDVYALSGAVNTSEMEIAGPGGTLNSEYVQKLYSFKYCWVKEVTGLDYSYSSSDVITVSATIGFFDYEDPQNLL